VDGDPSRYTCNPVFRPLFVTILAGRLADALWLQGLDICILSLKKRNAEGDRGSCSVVGKNSHLSSALALHHSLPSDPNATERTSHS
jgi:hypothetical protein